jgi:hypothetical protein
MSLDRLLGTWDISLRHVSVPEPVAGRQRYERVLAEAFVLLSATYDHPDFPDALALLDESRCHYFDVRGVTRTFDLEVDHSGWTMIRRDADFWQRSGASFTGPDAMAGRGENSHDRGASWQDDFTISYTRAL